MSTLFTLARQTAEAQAVRLGIPVARHFTDTELAPSTRLLEQSERELYGNLRLAAARAPLCAIDPVRDQWIAAETERILDTPDEICALLADHWADHPAKVAAIVRAMIGADDFLRRAALSDLADLQVKIAETAACERYRGRAAA